MDRLRGTPSQVQEVLREVGRITIHDLWGDRPKRDLTRLPAVVNSIANRLRIAQGCAAAVTRLFVQLKMVCADIDEKTTWARTTGIGTKVPQAAPLVVAPQPKAAGIKSIRFDLTNVRRLRGRIFMAAFATMALAEARAKVLMSTGVATVAHVQRDTDGTISVRILRPCSTAGYGIASSTVTAQHWRRLGYSDG